MARGTSSFKPTLGQSGWLVVVILSALICVTQLSAAFPYGRSSPVTELSPANFNQFVETHKPVVVLFYAPWCGHCKQFHAAFEQFAASVKGTVRVGALNADEHRGLGQQYGIQGFPTIKYWQMGKKNINSPTDYQGQRTTAALQSRVMSDITPTRVQKISSGDALHALLASSPTRQAAVLFSSKSKVPPIFSVLALSPKLKDLPFVFVGEGAETTMAASLGVRELPTVTIVRSPVLEKEGGTPRAEAVLYTGGKIAYEPLAQFFLNCLEGDCGATSTKGGSEATLPEKTESTPTTEAHADMRKTAISGSPVLYAPNMLAAHCLPPASKMSKQSTLCVIRLSAKAPFADVIQFFRHEPLVFIDASGAHEDVGKELVTDYGLPWNAMVPSEKNAECVLLLRRGKPDVVRYHVLEGVTDSHVLRNALEKVLSGETRLTSYRVGG